MELVIGDNLDFGVDLGFLQGGGEGCEKLGVCSVRGGVKLLADAEMRGGCSALGEAVG